MQKLPCGSVDVKLIEAVTLPPEALSGAVIVLRQYIEPVQVYAFVSPKHETLQV